LYEAAARRLREIPHSVSWRAKTALAEKNRERLAAFRNKHRGERGVIVANGPSLKRTDLTRLRSEITFGLNRIYLLFEERQFRPTYYAAINELVLEQFAPDIGQLEMPKFLNWNRRRFFEASDPTISFLKFRFSADDGFQSDMTQPLFTGGTVTFATLQVAYYMGFTEVVLVGLDHNFRYAGAPNTTDVQGDDRDPNHFHPDYFPKGVKWQLPDLHRMELAYSVARQAFEADGRRILDVTLDGKCPVFERADFGAVFG
jgi:hypothetical protein